MNNKTSFYFQPFREKLKANRREIGQRNSRNLSQKVSSPNSSFNSRETQLFRFIPTLVRYVRFINGINEMAARDGSNKMCVYIYKIKKKEEKSGKKFTSR